MSEMPDTVVGVTAERRAEEFIAALERNGLTVWHAPTIRIVPLAGDELLRQATERLVERPPGLLAVTTGAGFRGWVEAAGEWGLADKLLAGFGQARVLVRGPKARGAVRGLGLRDDWSAPDETNAELFGTLASMLTGDERVAVQLHGVPLPEHTDPLVAAGADVVEVQPYRWQWPDDLEPAHRLLDGVLDGRVRVLAFTSAPAAANLLTLAERRGLLDELLTALRGDGVLCACVGSVTAAPLTERGVPTVQPERSRLGALVKLIAAELERRS
ncbi:uroporphyrinogen-III synthase [Amycolatopsis suaedae]|uniref:Uroporphyrinogen-III synthase n=1 Tax=Amycolatopsis suaedae TaxID=2510978 RepID=A0A4Q7J4X2_9PSEU|nr:uroporphyrinogen-III synthase [Amycolatopsis suaedae]RZQ62620.1 uroporphyrinogen-III synthase [Amycolatopsis suaedae]